MCEWRGCTSCSIDTANSPEKPFLHRTSHLKNSSISSSKDNHPERTLDHNDNLAQYLQQITTHPKVCGIPAVEAEQRNQKLGMQTKRHSQDKPSDYFCSNHHFVTPPHAFTHTVHPTPMTRYTVLKFSCSHLPIYPCKSDFGGSKQKLPASILQWAIIQ